MGIEFERLSAFRAEAFTISFEESFFRDAGALIASLRDLSVALITSVANIDLSFADSCSPSPCLLSSVNETLLPFRFAGAPFTLFPFAAVVDLIEDFKTGASGATGFGNKRSLSNVAVVGVQVDVELTAARIESAVACKEAIMIQNTSCCVIEDYTLSRTCSGKLYVQRNNSVRLSRSISMFGWRDSSA
jgi:hypothetical protein